MGMFKQCSHKAHELNQSDWPFGQVWFEQRQYCDCGAPVFEVLRSEERRVGKEC